MTMKKLLTCVLALLLLAGSFAGCGENTDTPDAAGSGEKDTEMDSPEISETELPETELSDELPEKDYGAVDFNVLVRQEFLYEFSSDLTGEVVDDAIYNRNAEVGERFNLNLQIKDVTGSWSTQETFKSTIRNSVMAQDGEFDMIAASANYAMAMAGEGLFTNLHDCEYLDFAKPWWDAGFTDNMQVGGNLYLATGDIALTSIENMCVFLFNKQLAANYAVGDLYAMVRQGTWTWENMAAIAEGCYSDLDANGVMDSADQYGLLTYGNMIRAMVQSFEIPYTARDENGFPTVTFMSERLVNAAEMVTAFVQDSAACWDYSLNNYGDTLDIATAMQTYFSQNQAMFLSQVLSSAEVL
ncbi:MAG: hypothetical protein ACI4V1_07635, partial [Eubacteriales bacterium]